MGKTQKDCETPLVLGRGAEQSVKILKELNAEIIGEKISNKI